MVALVLKYDIVQAVYCARTSTLRLQVSRAAKSFSCFRWGNTPVDEARVSGNKQMIGLLEEAKSAQLSEFPDVPHEISGIARTTLSSDCQKLVALHILV